MDEASAPNDRAVLEERQAPAEPGVAEGAVPAPDPTTAALLAELRQVGQTAPRELLDRVRALGEPVIPHLAAMATDRALHEADEDSPEVWAPLHAIKLLGELKAVEAVKPLLPLFLWDDDDYAPEAVAEAFIEMGPPLFEIAHAIFSADVFTVWSRGRAADVMAGLGRRHPELRDDAIAGLRAGLLLRRAETEDDAILNGMVVFDLVKLNALETVRDIALAFADDIVDLMMIRPEDVLDHWAPLLGPEETTRFALTTGLSPVRAPARAPDRAPVPVAQLDPPPNRPAARTVGSTAKVGRNDPCPCGSGKKYKKCCGR